MDNYFHRRLTNDEERVPMLLSEEARIVGDPSYGQKQEIMVEMNDDVPDGQKKKNHRCLIVVALFYCLLVVVIFVWPRYASKESDDGFAQIANGIGIIFGVGSIALIISIVSLILTIRRWNEMPGSMRAVGLFPIVCSVTIVVVLGILVGVQNSQEDDSDSPACPGGEGCPVPKNVTRRLY